MELETMNKTELRTACKNAKIKNYSKMTVAGMREALTKLTTTRKVDGSLLADIFPTRSKKRSAKKAPPPRAKREVRNDVARPMRGVCADTWAALDELRAKGEEDLTTAIHAIGEQRGWNRNNVSIELSRWRKYNGLVPSRKTRGASD